MSLIMNASAKPAPTWTARKRTKLYCGPKTSITPADLPGYDATGVWAFEEKKDGVWCAATVKDGVIVQMESRVGLCYDGADSAGLLGRQLVAGDGILVGELVADLVNSERTGTRRLYLFDVIEWNGLNLRTLSNAERRQALEMIYNASVGEDDRDLVKLVERREGDAQAFYDEVISRGGEGLVGKSKKAPYGATNSDGKVDSMVRCKPARTIDYVVISHGFSKRTTRQPGGSPQLNLGLYVNGKLEAVQDVAPPAKWGKLPLDSVVGKVVECLGAEMYPTGTLRHSRVIRVRDDKAATDCTLEAALRDGGIRR
jgi:ATP-dependent DNA ligase